MALSEEIGKLGELHRRGDLSDGEFAAAKAQLLNPPSHRYPAADAASSINALNRSLTDRWLGGVCGGLAEHFGLAAWIWRLLFTALALCGGTGVLLYALLWVFVPRAATPGPVAVARGEPA